MRWCSAVYTAVCLCALRRYQSSENPFLCCTVSTTHTDCDARWVLVAGTLRGWRLWTRRGSYISAQSSPRCDCLFCGLCLQPCSGAATHYCRTRSSWPYTPSSAWYVVALQRNSSQPQSVSTLPCMVIGLRYLKSLFVWCAAP